jgi:hypothetical protein
VADFHCADSDDLDRIRSLKKNLDPGSSLCKILYQLFVTRNFCYKKATKHFLTEEGTQMNFNVFTQPVPILFFTKRLFISQFCSLESRIRSQKNSGSGPKRIPDPTRKFFFVEVPFNRSEFKTRSYHTVPVLRIWTIFDRIRILT